jgi:ABC-type sugar transport system permease subunit
MNSTDQSTIDAGQIDGVGFFGELWHIVLPKSYGVISIGFYTGFASLFVNQLGLYAFKGENAEASISTLGYYYYVEVQRATAADNLTKYPFWAAWGLVSSAITIPVTFLLRYMVTHIGPSEE